MYFIVEHCTKFSILSSASHKSNLSMIKNQHFDEKKAVKKNKTITKLQKNQQQQHKTHLIPSNPSSELFIVKIGARAYALATRRLPSNTMILAQISSSI